GSGRAAPIIYSASGKADSSIRDSPRRWRPGGRGNSRAGRLRVERPSSSFCAGTLKGQPREVLKGKDTNHVLIEFQDAEPTRGADLEGERPVRLDSLVPVSIMPIRELPHRPADDVIRDRDGVSVLEEVLQRELELDGRRFFQQVPGLPPD